MTLGMARLVVTGGVPQLVEDTFSRARWSDTTWPHRPLDPMGAPGIETPWVQWPGYGAFSTAQVNPGGGAVPGATAMPANAVRFGSIIADWGWLTAVETHSTNAELSLGVGMGGRASTGRLAGLFGGDALYFRVVDPENWWRLRVVSQYRVRSEGDVYRYRDLGRVEDTAPPAPGVPAHYHPGYWAEYEDTPQPEAPPITAGMSLARGQRWESFSGRVALVHQTDGNVVLYRDGVARWSSGSQGKASSTLNMQADGNLVLYALGGAVIWQSDTDGRPGAVLRVQNDGNVVIYHGGLLPANSVWATNTRVAPDTRDLLWATPDTTVTHSHDGWPSHSHRSHPGIAIGGSLWTSGNQGVLSKLHLDCKVAGKVTTLAQIVVEEWAGPDASGALLGRAAGLDTHRIRVRAAGHRIEAFLGDETTPLVTIINGTHYGATMHGLGRGYSEGRGSAMHAFRAELLR